jgi:hypothetical protein
MHTYNPKTNHHTQQDANSEDKKKAFCPVKVIAFLMLRMALKASEHTRTSFNSVCCGG